MWQSYPARKHAETNKQKKLKANGGKKTKFDIFDGTTGSDLKTRRATYDPAPPCVSTKRPKAAEGGVSQRMTKERTTAVATVTVLLSSAWLAIRQTSIINGVVGWSDFRIRGYVANRRGQWKV